ncbi:hypothetical protein BGW80DRAFT_187048 [Lactifluus volemus]|nr:hypothetical protein BGW80DRAFT_187048 [Lactifluus volemus]
MLALWLCTFIPNNYLTSLPASLFVIDILARLAFHYVPLSLAPLGHFSLCLLLYQSTHDLFPFHTTIPHALTSSTSFLILLTNTLSAMLMALRLEWTVIYINHM